MQALSDTPRIDSSEWWARPYREVAPKDPDTATARTIQIMCQLANESSRADVVKRAAEDAVRRFAAFAGGLNPAGISGACWWWCKTFLKFEHHELIIRARLGEYGHLQGLIAPDALLLLHQWVGDCAIYSMLLAAMLEVCGIQYEFVTAAVNPNEPEIYSHVYVYAVMPDGARIPLDASHGDYPGWQVPSQDIFRLQVWSASGNPVSDQGSRWEGLGMYGCRRGRGLGQIIEDSGVYDPGVFTGDVTPTSGLNLQALYPLGTSGPSGGPLPGTSPGGAGVDWGSILGSQLSQWTKIAGNVIAPQTTIARGPGGQLLVTGPAGSTPNVAGALAVGTSSTSWMWIAGAVVVAVIVVPMLTRR